MEKKVFRRKLVGGIGYAKTTISILIGLILFIAIQIFLGILLAKTFASFGFLVGVICIVLFIGVVTFIVGFIVE